MARARKNTVSDDSQVNSKNLETKPEPQTIIAPTLGSITEMGFSAPQKAEPIVVEKKFDINRRIYSVYSDGDFVEDIDEESEKLDFYLEENKKQLELFITELKTIVTDPNILIFFHEGKQNRQYLSFESYYAQNGLAPKAQTINSWIDFYKSKYPMMTDEEIAIKAKGNLRYSFTIKID